MDGIGMLLKDFRGCERFTKEEETFLWTNWILYGDLSARNRLIMSVAPWVTKIASRIDCQGMSKDDVIAEGLAIVVNKFHKFNPERGRLTTFVGSILWRALQREINIHQHVITISDPCNALRSSDDTNTKRAAVNNGIYMLGQVERPEEFLSERSSYGHTVDGSVDEEIEKHDRHRQFKAAISKLDERTRAIIQGCIDGLTYKEIGCKIGISKERVRQIRDSAIEEIQVIAGVLKPSQRQRPRIQSMIDQESNQEMMASA